MAQDRLADRARLASAGLAAALVLLGGCSSQAGGPAASQPAAAPATSPTDSPSPSPSGPPPMLAPPARVGEGSPVDRIPCQQMEQLAFHVHAHLAVYVDGDARLIPPGIGVKPPLQLQQRAEGPFIAGGVCLYWLHTHDSSGVIHVEAPRSRAFTLGDFFDVWGQPLGPSQVGPARGPVHAFLNGSPVKGNPRQIQLADHSLVQLDVGTVVPFQPFTPPGSSASAGAGS